MKSTNKSLLFVDVNTEEAAAINGGITYGIFFRRDGSLVVPTGSIFSRREVELGAKAIQNQIASSYI